MKRRSSESTRWTLGKGAAPAKEVLAVLALLLKERMISSEPVEQMKTWRHSGFHAYDGEEIPDIPDVLRVGLYMVRGPAATSRLRTDPAQEPKLRYLAKGAVPDHG